MKDITIKIYLIGLKKPLTCVLDNETQLDKLDMLLKEGNQVGNTVSFGCICFSRDKFICYTIE